MNILEGGFYYEFELDKSVKLIYTKKPFLVDVKDINNENFIFIPSNKKIKYLKQLHTNNIYYVDSNFQNFKEGDGFITDCDEIALVAYYADCLPIYFYDRIKKRIGLAHSGYKGTFDLIILKMLTLMKDMGSNFKDIEIVFGPYNKGCCYEVNYEFLKEVKKDFNQELIDCSFSFKEDKIYFDNGKFNLKIISYFNLLGVKSFNLCTYCNQNLYSSRRLKGERSFAAIWSV